MVKVADRAMVRGADGKPIRPSEHRVRFGGQVTIDEVDFPPPKAKIRGTFEAETGSFGLDPLKKGWVAVIELNVKELQIEEISEKPDNQPELPGVEEGDGEE